MTYSNKRPYSPNTYSDKQLSHAKLALFGLVT